MCDTGVTHAGPTGHRQGTLSVACKSPPRASLWDQQPTGPPGMTTHRSGSPWGRSCLAASPEPVSRVPRASPPHHHVPRPVRQGHQSAGSSAPSRLFPAGCPAPLRAPRPLEVVATQQGHGRVLEAREPWLPRGQRHREGRGAKLEKSPQSGGGSKTGVRHLPSQAVKPPPGRAAAPPSGRVRAA